MWRILESEAQRNEYSSCIKWNSRCFPNHINLLKWNLVSDRKHYQRFCSRCNFRCLPTIFARNIAHFGRPLKPIKQCVNIDVSLFLCLQKNCSKLIIRTLISFCSFLQCYFAIEWCFYRSLQRYGARKGIVLLARFCFVLFPNWMPWIDSKNSNSNRGAKRIAYAFCAYFRLLFTLFLFFNLPTQKYFQRFSAVPFIFRSIRLGALSIRSANAKRVEFICFVIDSDYGTVHT